LGRLDADGDCCFVTWDARPADSAETMQRVGYMGAYDLVYGTVACVTPIDRDAGAAHAIAHAGERVTKENFKRGAVVTRGPGWRWGDQDCGKPGFLMRVADDEALGITKVYVRWADNSENVYIGSHLVFGSSADVAAAAEPEATLEARRAQAAALRGQPVTQRNFISGATVARGPDWKWGTQDGSGLPGRLVEVCGNGTARVRWESGQSNAYRIGAEDSHDLVYGDIPWSALQTPAPSAPAPQAAGEAAQPQSRDGQRVTVELVTAGAVVSRGPDWKWGDQDGGKPGRLTGDVLRGARAFVEWEDGSMCAYRVSDGIADLVFGPRPFDAMNAA
jgi:hypothetical protein